MPHLNLSQIDESHDKSHQRTVQDGADHRRIEALAVRYADSATAVSRLRCAATWSWWTTVTSIAPGGARRREFLRQIARAKRL
jgi:hypothetical protein